MAIRKLRQLSENSCGVTIPKADLRESGFLDERGELDGEHYAVVEYVGDGEWRVRAVELL